MVRKKYDTPLAVRLKAEEKEAIAQLMAATGECRNSVIRHALRFAASQITELKAQNEEPRSAA